MKFTNPVVGKPNPLIKKSAPGNGINRIKKDKRVTTPIVKKEPIEKVKPSKSKNNLKMKKVTSKSIKRAF
jgi:hypothetical protein